MKLSKQQKQVYDWFKNNPRTTVREAGRNIFPGVDKVSARLSELERLGVKIERHGRNKSREMLYSIGQPLTKKVQRTEMTANGMRVWYEVVSI